MHLHTSLQQVSSTILRGQKGSSNFVQSSRQNSWLHSNQNSVALGAAICCCIWSMPCNGVVVRPDQLACPICPRFHRNHNDWSSYTDDGPLGLLGSLPRHHLGLHGCPHRCSQHCVLVPNESPGAQKPQHWVGLYDIFWKHGWHFGAIRLSFKIRAILPYRVCNLHGCHSYGRSGQRDVHLTHHQKK